MTDFAYRFEGKEKQSVVSALFNRKPVKGRLDIISTVLFETYE